MDERALALLCARLEENIQFNVDALVGGSSKDFAEVRTLVGVIRGLRVAQGLIEDLRKKLERDDD